MTVLIIVLIIIALLFIIPLFTKKEYEVERDVVIDKPKNQVFDYIKYLKNQDHYSVWAKIDPNMKKEYKGVDGTPGFMAAWDSDNKKAGKGEQTIKSLNEGEAIFYTIHFIKPFEGLADASMATTQISENQTKINWHFKSKMNYPMNMMLLFMDMDKMIGNDLSNGLSNLKKLLEK